MVQHDTGPGGNKRDDHQACGGRYGSDLSYVVDFNIGIDVYLTVFSGTMRTQKLT